MGWSNMHISNKKYEDLYTMHPSLDEQCTYNHTCTFLSIAQRGGIRHWVSFVFLIAILSEWMSDLVYLPFSDEYHGTILMRSQQWLR